MEKLGNSSSSSVSTTDTTARGPAAEESSKDTSGEPLQYYEFEVLESTNKLRKRGGDDEEHKKKKKKKMLVGLDEEGEGFVELPPNYYKKPPQVAASNPKVKKRIRNLSAEYNNAVLRDALMRSIRKNNYNSTGDYAGCKQVDLELKLGR